MRILLHSIRYILNLNPTTKINRENFNEQE
jgi:hypothetical protein